MHFEIVANSNRVPSEGTDVGYLWEDNWNDWWTYRTLYVLTVFDLDGAKHDIGGVKIGQFGMEEKQAKPDLPRRFEGLGEEFFSLGQDASYYTNLKSLGDAVANEVLLGLHPVPKTPGLV